jgi:RimJ/RimL family protein N-acetyltransferase
VAIFVYVESSMQYEIETKRLILAPFVDADIDRRVALANNINVARMVTSMPHPYTRKDAEEWVTLHDAGRAAGTDFPFAITLKNEGLVGAVGLHKKSGPEFELGYWVGEPYWGRGIASEAAIAVMNWARDAIGLTHAVACYFEDNPASKRVLEKAGFVADGSEANCHSIGRGEKARSLNMVWRDNATQTR